MNWIVYRHQNSAQNGTVVHWNHQLTNIVRAYADARFRFVWQALVEPISSHSISLDVEIFIHCIYGMWMQLLVYVYLRIVLVNLSNSL